MEISPRDIALIGRVVGKPKALFIQCYLGRPHDEGAAQEIHEGVETQAFDLQPRLAAETSRHGNGQMATGQRMDTGRKGKNKSTRKAAP